MQKNIVEIPGREEKITEEHEQKFLNFINKDGIHYERILLKKHYKRVMAILRGENPPPYELEIQPCSECNALCNHCWAKSLKKLDNRLNTEKAINKVIDEALGFEENDFKIDTIKLCGSTGEPLKNSLVPLIINKVYLKKELRLFTNGIILAENKDNELFLRTISKVSRLNESLDAASTASLHRIKIGARHINLEEILEASRKIRGFSENGLIVEASYVITNENYQEIISFVKKIKDFEAADAIRFRIDLTDRTVSKNHGNEILDSLEEAKSYESEGFRIIPLHSEEEIKQENEGYFTSRDSGFKCFISRIWACLGADGSLFPCGHIVSGDAENYGNVLENGLANVWNSHEREDLVNRLPTDKCSICSPFSLRINRFLNEISHWPTREVNALYKKYINNEK
jgi:radical SAM protein with 4Fe4S-binding SPASM domain